MIISNIIGGLGNQMFQYATGRALSINVKQSLTLDISGFNSYPLHNGFELQRVFKLPSSIASESDIAKVIGRFPALAIRIGLPSKYLKLIAGQNYIKEPSFAYWDGLLKLSGNYYLDGYWQSEKYFKDFSEQIRRDFVFRSEITDANKSTALQIKDSCSVSCHIRRGDYITNIKAYHTHGVCSLDYYVNSINLIKARLVNPRFFIFSDDQDWVKSNITFPENSVFVDGNHGTDSFRDMQLMSLCKHHIVANSSFSWWGAWLNPNESKIIIAPKKWFSVDIDDSDLIPDSWIRL